LLLLLLLLLRIDVIYVIVVIIVVVKSSFFSLFLFLVNSKIIFSAYISVSVLVVVEPGRDSLHFRISLQKLLDRSVLVAAIAARLGGLVVAENLRRNETSRRRWRHDDCHGFRFVENVVRIVVVVEILFFLVIVVVVVVVQDKTFKV
jgi:hypothetical protein